ncbi:D-arabinono-1,4-lactone oxidase [Bacillus sp. 7884-1]|uniref:D-arabinono-1,4-lactone oxidase n=1 Tax=Bacillus sp. 7884-1 TaxID=2021693 RepID=UPI000BA6739F|nr:D-arabinono-1,4-lactone oxidase [Bacillus sp. 7884-1]PAE38038.1 FAD-binding oxidoreductase [Bacillus sp. 7884-1]
MFSLKENQKIWQNWSGIVQSKPTHIAFPASVEDVVSLVKRCKEVGRGIRIVGSGHSFTPVIHTNEVLVSLDHLAGVEKVDAVTQTVGVWAGTKLRDLSAALHAQGWAQENLGDIDKQSIAGAISTGTHGTGSKLGSIATQAVEIQVVTAVGEVLTCNRESHPDLFRALQVSLGMLGIIVKVTLRVIPATVLTYESIRLSLDECFKHLAEFRDDYRNFEFFWFPHTDTIQAKLMNEATNQLPSNRFWRNLNQMVMENALFGVLSRVCRTIPSLSKSISSLSAKFVDTGKDVGYTHQLFTTTRLVRFNEMEYSVPAELMETVVREIHQLVEKNDYHVHFPVECRYVKGDDIWLSPAHGRDSAYIAVHMYKGMEHEKYFADIEAIFRRYNGRPHWGKLHTLRGDNLTTLYPKIGDFKKIRQQLDPKGIFLNDYLKKLFAIE